MKKFLLIILTLRETVRTEYGEGFHSYFRWFYFSLLRRNCFVLFRLDSAGHNCLGVSPTLPVNFQVISPSQEMLEVIRRKRSLPREFFMDRVCKLTSCYLAMINSEPAYIHWIFTQGDDSRFLTLKEGTAEINYIVTLEKYRGRKLCSAMLLYTSDILFSQGFQRIVAVVHDENISSIKSFERAGFNRIGTIATLGRFHKKVTV